MGKSVRRLVPEGLPWQPPASAPVATEAEETAGSGQPGQAEGAAAEGTASAGPTEGPLAAPPTPRTRATPRQSEDIEKLSGPERRRLKEENKNIDFDQRRKGWESTMARSPEAVAKR
eukprot:4494401-Heterocapsa_arctica.AAC.1